MVIEVSKKIKDITGAIIGMAAVGSLILGGWITFSGFIDEKIDTNINLKIKDPKFMSKVKGELSSVVKKVDGLYKVDSGYSSILSFDFKSLKTKQTKVKFHADVGNQKVILSVYPIGHPVADDDFTIHIDNEKQEINLWGQISGRDITNLLSKNGGQSKYMHTLQFVPNTKKYANSAKDKVVRALEIFILVRNIERKE